MAPSTPLPFSSDFRSADEYVDSLLQFSAASTIFQTLCGGVHILDFFTREPSLYHTVIPAEWREWLLARDSMNLLDFLMRDDLAKGRDDDPPESLVNYIRDIRKHSLQREVPPERQRGGTKLPRHVAVGMIPKKIHEVGNFADYVVRVAESVHEKTGKGITHYVDFGSGQNYLGRTLASPPYNKHIVAVESKELNINGAKNMDVLAGVAEREVVMRNKKVYRMVQDSMTPAEQMSDKALRRVAKPQKAPPMNTVDLRPSKDLATIYTPADGKGYIQYVEHVVQDGDLSDVVEQIGKMKIAAPTGQLQVVNADAENPKLPEVIEDITNSKDEETRLMAISIHSCGNLSHHGIRSLLLNPSVHAIAIVGCCYNLLTERLGPPTLKLPLLRPNLRAINGTGPFQKATSCDPHGYPMSEKVATYNGDGARLNITARMMAVQAPLNWTEKESDAFFTRHFYRALLQKVFLDFGVVKKLRANQEDGEPSNNLESTEPVIVGSLRKGCYGSFKSYVRGALEKLASDPVRDGKINEQMRGITDEQIEEYAARYGKLKRELSVSWSLMAFSAGVAESLIVTDRWLWLKEQQGVSDAWVEAVFEYGLSPRNLVVVGIKA
ncbi:hypothetical protein MBM_08509 [Drepanopeziza brunnea f. sp. 'multigermtubi' MB_m1]|uniref:Methyltransferase domain-containing protein n=2 Tax=Drepanopeziza brunnea f. sp. 'multigermtubi' TaxID=698441 RepID=K1WKL7_MARBU|nr:uncharacterized protein MBM_08509 [Drepanopeziza brunnea f. sp. 'multigermtubi' MB_m1]EKD13426.1 hypothetical protein MBM_08509 [Drepanopeziza brunnea f. sp. 'multigermtubi' MB_m1]